ncbi:MAG TPA: WecB/TagA/CpsF family glycosyltransferase [Patescibacteria group bacterium]|nr:WecB/TagA/CpsF family glycosyltransferase [Patescibacteria group bacterium]
MLGVGLTNVTEQEVLEFIVTGLEKQKEKYYIVTPNPELLVIADKNSGYKTILNRAKLALPDGIGVMIAARLIGKPLKARIHGVDLMENLCREVSNRPITVGFLGAGPGVAEQAAECLKKRYPRLKVGLVASEWSEALKDKKIDILFVAFGSPKQEIWIADNLKALPAKIIVGVGGAFDFISGKVPRAPKVFRSLGLEWLFRLSIQPWRIKRQLSLIKFVVLILKEKLKS